MQASAEEAVAAAQQELDTTASALSEALQAVATAEDACNAAQSGGDGSSEDVAEAKVAAAQINLTCSANTDLRRPLRQLMSAFRSLRPNWPA